MADFNKAIELDSGLGLAYQNRGDLYVAQGDLTKAMDDYDQAVEFAPSEPKIRLSHGDARRRLKQFEDAVADFDKVIELNPRSAEASKDAAWPICRWENTLRGSTTLTTPCRSVQAGRANWTKS